jgi:uncharacterized membrane protein YfcA
MLVQSIAGFGSALLGMPLLLLFFPLKVAAPLFVLCSFVVEIIMLAKYRRAILFRNIWRLLLACLIGIPIGVNVIANLDERLMTGLLGAFVLAYAIYSLMGFKAPPLKHVGWQFGLGFIAGMLSGAYNTSGPVYVVYSNSQSWSPAEFKGHIVALFLVGSTGTIISHYLAGNMTSEVIDLFVIALPAALIAVFAGMAMDRFVRPELFRKMVLILLVIIGLNLIF